MPFDQHKNFAVSAVVVAPSPTTSGTTLTVTTGTGSLFPAAPFNATVCPANAQPLVNNAEIVRVTDVTGDVLTILRAQEGTSARAIQVGDQIFSPETAKTLNDIEGAITAIQNATATLISAVNVSAGKVAVVGPVKTDVNGKVTVLLINGRSYYLWMSKAGENPIVGSLFIAVAD